MRYHAECFSGFADPRSQASSSAHVGNLAGTQFAAAPAQKAGSKMRTGSHFVGKSDRGSGGKIGAFLGGSHSFGSQSAKGQGISAQATRMPSGPGEGFSMEQLEEHNRRMEKESEDT
jgi:hypothetical protein